MVAPGSERQFPERYAAVRKLGEGGMGVVWEAYDHERNLRVALKTLSRMSPLTLSLFKQEFRALSGIAHPNLVTLYDLHAGEEGYFLAMEYVDGVGLLEHVHPSSADESAAGSSHGALLQSEATRTMVELPEPAPVRFIETTARPLDEERLRASLRQVAEGLHALHGAGKLHRDVKPSNILVERGGRAVLLDFGLVLEQSDALEESQDSLRIGTLAYMAPEALAGEPLTPAADWYALGVVLYQALTNRLPAAGRKAEAPAPRRLNPAAPADLDELCRRLMERNPTLRPGGEEVIRRLGGSVSGEAADGTGEVFVGREAQLEQLEEAWRRARGGQPMVVLLSGLSGAGKSALAARFLGRVKRDAGAMTLAGRCWERESAPYKAFDAAIGRLSRQLRRLPREELQALLPAEAATVARLFPEFDRALRLLGEPHAAAPEARDAVELRRAGFAALRELLRRLAQRQALLVWLDDLQWSDTESAALLAEILRGPGAPPLLLLASFRSGESERSAGLRALLEAVEASPADVLRMELPPLSPAESAELASHVGGGALAAGRAAAIAADSGGMPMFIRELARHRDAGEGKPPALEELIARRISALPGDARRLMEVLALAGRPLAQIDAYSAAGLASRSPAVLNRLTQAGLAKSSGPRELDVVETYHDRVRQTIAAGLEPARKREHHRRLAETLEASRHAEPEMIGAQFEACGETARAGIHYRRAAGQALNALAFDHAAELFARTLRVAELTSGERLELHCQMAEAQAFAGRSGEAGRTYREAVALAPGEARRLQLEGKAAYHLSAGGELEAGLELTRQVCARLGIPVRSSNLALVAAIVRNELRIGWALRRLPPTGTGASPEALARIDFLWEAARGAGWTMMFLSFEMMQRSLLEAARAGEPVRLARAIAMHGAGLTTAGHGQYDKFQRRVALARRLFERAELTPDAAVFIEMGECQGKYLAGLVAESLEHARRAELLIEQACRGLSWELSSVRLVKLWAYQTLGRMGALAEEAQRLHQDAVERGDRLTATNLSCLPLPIALLSLDRAAEAVRVRREAIVNWRPGRYSLQHTMAMQAEMYTCLYEGRPQEALTAARRDRAALAGMLPRSHAVIEMVMADLTSRALLSPEWTGEERRRAAEAAPLLARLRRIPLPAAPAYARQAEAARDALLGERGLAVTGMREASRLFAAQGMALHERAALLRAGLWLGGAEGEAMTAAAVEWMQGEGIAQPRRMARVFGV